MTLPDGVILAGGLSRRMGGGDKALLPLGGSTLLGHVIERLRPQVAGLALNANGDPDRFSGFGLPVLADSIPDYAGPLAGVLAAMDWAAGNGSELVVTAAADTPFFPDHLVSALRSAAYTQETPLAMAMTQGPGGRLLRHPTFGLWSVALRDDLRAALQDGVRKVIEWTARHGCAEAVFHDPRFDPFFNVNTPEDMAQAKQYFRSIDA